MVCTLANSRSKKIWVFGGFVSNYYIRVGSVSGDVYMGCKLPDLAYLQTVIANAAKRFAQVIKINRVGIL